MADEKSSVSGAESTRNPWGWYAVRMRLGWFLVFSAAWLSCSEEAKSPSENSSSPYPLDNELRLNHLQAEGTHNSYHVMTEGTTIVEHQYTLQPLDVQLSQQGVRAFELDTRFDAKVDGFRVYHLGFVDEKTNCETMIACLQVLRSWSDANPRHHPLLVQFEPKDNVPSDAEAYFSRMEKDIQSVWPREKIITPDDVKGAAATLRDAVTTTGWPTLGASRGKILFFLNNTDDFRKRYTRDLTSLDGRLMFAEASPEDPFAAVVILNDPEQNKAAIESAVKAGFLVRTRADGDIEKDRLNDTTQREAAFASGAHIVSTDFPAPVPGVEYFVEIPGGTPSRCNPLIAPAGCTSQDIESPDRLR